MHWGPGIETQVQEISTEQPCEQFSWNQLYTTVCACTSFDDLRRLVNQIKLPEVHHQPLPVWQHGISIDNVAKTELMMLTDTDHIGAGVPVSTIGDGNCFPCAANKLMFGSEDNHLEVRLHLVFKAVLNEDQYLSEEYLSEGVRRRNCGTPLSLMYAMYSGHYTGIQGFSCTEDAVQDAFRKDVMSIYQTGKYMGMFQMFALSNVMKRSIHSVFPNRGKS